MTVTTFKPHMKALDKQVDLIRYFKSEAGIRYATGYAMSLSNSGQSHVGESYGMNLAQWQAARLDQADTYWVAAEMQGLVEHAAESYPTSEPLLRVDLPTPTGFVLFERSTFFTDRWGKRLSYKALAWWEAVPLTKGEHIPGVEVAFYTDPMEEDDELNQEVALDYRKNQGLSLVHIGFWPYEETVDGLVDEGKERGYEEHILESAEAMMSFQKTFWRLIQQRIAYIDRRPPDRHALKRAQRAGFLPEMEEVKVVTLRKYSENQPELPDSEPGTVDWSHRWIVDGFWRNQWYSKAGIHRRIWIAPFIKGPAHLPVLVKDKVYKWIR